jgi:hypothetical protein
MWQKGARMRARLAAARRRSSFSTERFLGRETNSSLILFLHLAECWDRGAHFPNCSGVAILARI